VSLLAYIIPALLAVWGIFALGVACWLIAESLRSR
jgi:hypothetical protein